MITTDLLETLKPFCSVDKSRAVLHAPWSHGERTFATDGRILVWVPRLDSVPERPDAPTKGVLAVIEENPHRPDPITIPELPEHKFETCDICEKGKIIVDHHKNETIPCSECEGEWKWRKGIGVMIGDQLLSDIYLEKIKGLPNAAIFNSSKDRLCAAGFTFGGGAGLLMPMRER